MAVQRLEVSGSKFSPENFVTLTVYSSHLNGRADISVYREASESKDLPIVILLHGVYGSHWVWSQLGGAHEVYATLRKAGLPECVLVMPSDGAHQEGSGYLPLENANYEKWIVEDVIDAVIQTQDMCSKDSSVYISGLSMGGYGALRLGAKYPSVFAGISAHSSITQLDDFVHFVDEKTREPLSKHSDEYNGDVFDTLVANQDKLPPLRFDCGKDDVLFEANQALVAKLEKTDITFSFDAFSGEHAWEYWNEHLAKTLQFFADLEAKDKV
ncbi:alpha/beta hydrolase [Agaribacter flavus]|uniref:Alpha/beta hydrolase n=1 Tax=Agaribacter flavus TaxID=1902781 RepID=A0ABV7FK63_9ALTE